MRTIEKASGRRAGSAGERDPGVKRISGFRFTSQKSMKPTKINMTSVYLQQYTIYNATKHHVYGIFSNFDPRVPNII